MQISENSLLAFVKIAYQCLNRMPSWRPTMAQVVVLLEFALELQESPDSGRVVGAISSDSVQNSTAMEVVYGPHQIKPFEMNRTRITFSKKVFQILSTPIQVLSVDSNAKYSIYNRNKNGGFGNRVRLNKIRTCPESNKIDIFPAAKGLMATANLRRFSLAELGSAIRGFSPDMLLAVGNHGRVYIGWLDEDTLAPSSTDIGMTVTIRRFNLHEKFRAMQKMEVDLCGRYYHPNLVKLLGFCSEGQEFLLVFEYTTKGTLERYACKDNGELLSWVVWLKILLGAARYLAFLHCSEDHIIYGDFKLSHVLLDGDFNPKVYDSGSARFSPADGDTLVTGIPRADAQYCAGSEGYLSPEYKEAGRLCSKNDVYAFGVVLLEILTGMRVVNVNERNTKMNLVDKARPFLACERSSRQ